MAVGIVSFKAVTTVYLCMIFKRNAVIGINRIYSTFDNIHSVPELRHAIDELFTQS